MRRIPLCVVSALFVLSAGCNSPFGPATIPPPAVSQGPATGDYYPSPFVTPPPASTATSTSPDGLTWQTPNPGSNLVTARGATISRSTLSDAPQNNAPEEPIRIVESSTAAGRSSVIPFNGAATTTPVALAPQPSNQYIEISQLPKAPGVLQALPKAGGPPSGSPPSPASRVRGFIPAVPQQNAVPANSLPASPPTTNARPRFSSATPGMRYDSAVAPAAYDEPLGRSADSSSDAASQWRAR